MAKTLELTVEQDHIESLAKVRNPIVAVEELIWNALDADATRVSVHTYTNDMGGLDCMLVHDNGTGIPVALCEQAFGHLGGSPKVHQRLTPCGRVPHGQLGRGRFRAFGIGKKVTWRSRYRDGEACREYEITGRRSSLKQFKIGGSTTSTLPSTGVEVRIEEIDRNFSSLLRAETAAEELSQRLALYLRKYPGIVITYDKEVIDPSGLELHEASYPLVLKDEDGADVAAELTVIEWKTASNRAIYFCDEEGFALEERQPGIHAPGFHFTAYVKSKLVRTLVDNGAFAFETLHPVAAGVVSAVKDSLRNHFRTREAAKAIDLVQRWREENVYPYEAVDRDPVQKAERQVFDVCAVKVHEYLPNFERTDVANKRFTFRLLREALARDAHSLQAILRQVLNLPKEQQDELAMLLDRTHLSAVINASRMVVDRLDFLQSLDSLLFGEFRETLLERRQLHRILAEELWLFGEQYTLAIDDQSLTKLLDKHIELLGRESLAPGAEPVLDQEDKKRIVDLMLAKTIPQLVPHRFEHLVIELKRPKCVLGKDELGQIETYAFAVSKDERFDRTRTKWTFLLIGNELDEFAEQKCAVAGREFGHIYESSDRSVSIFVKRWSTIISEAKWRHQFFRDKLELEVTNADGLNYLQSKYSDLLPN